MMNTSDIVGSHFFQRWLRGSSIAFALGVAAAVFVPGTAFAQVTPPSGEVQFQQSSIEPAYNDLTGKITYFMTPDKAPEHANGHAVAPIYLIVYPASASGVGTLNCQYQPADNCPSHGAKLAGLAELEEPSVYKNGVWGHDHLLAAPPSPPASGGDFNISWLPVIVLFTNSAAANTHITTLKQLDAELADHNVEEIPVPNGTFECVIVPAETYEMGTPVPTAPPAS
jgi:hypothetical protein